jgi:M6 family metalloprotease-like protein
MTPTRILLLLLVLFTVYARRPAAAQETLILNDPRVPRANSLNVADYRTVDQAVTTTVANGPRPPAWDERSLPLFRGPVYRLAVVPLDFPDKPHTPRVTPDDWRRALFSEGAYRGQSPTGQQVFGSLNDYYVEQSCGAFRIKGRVFNCVRVGRRQDAYAADADRTALLTEALDQLLARAGADALADFDGLLFLYAGERLAARPGDLFWPHRATLTYRDRHWPYCLCPAGGEQMASIGVLAHEFGHLLGLPDLYAPGDGRKAEPVGIWCTMANGHGREGKPLHLSAWCKERLGWLRPAVLDPRTPQKLRLRPVEGSSRECFKVLLRPDGGEYLLLENRAARGFDRDVPAEGLLVWRVVNGRPVLEDVPRETRADQPRGDKRPLPIRDVHRLPDGTVVFQIGGTGA